MNMRFKKKETQSEGDEISPPAPMQGKATDESEAKDPNDLKRIENDIVYPSGLKLALLMISVFVSMFLVSLVR
jgi:hypothetical protein